MRHTIFGESHGPAIGVTLERVPPGIPIDMDFIDREMQRRAPGKSPLATPRREADAVNIISGVYNGTTTGSPLCAIIENTNTRSQDYDSLRWRARPGHADYTAEKRYRGFQDFRGGGHFSGRLTAPLVFAGAVAKLILARHGISVMAHIRDIAGIEDARPDFATPDCSRLEEIAKKEFPVLDDARGALMQEAILKARGEHDSVGGSIECFVCGIPPGLGAPDFSQNVETLIAAHMFAIPAIKGIEFGAGFCLAAMRGSQANDPLQARDGHITTTSNHNGGINGGITNGMPIVFSVVVKPTPSIAHTQQTVNLQTLEPVTLEVGGRHDPCIVPRAVPVIEAGAALAICELLEHSHTAQ